MTMATSLLHKKKSSSLFGQGIIWVAYLLFFMMLFVPTTYQTIKAALLLLVLSAITIHSLKIGYLKLHSKIIFWTLFMMIVGILFTIHI